MPVYTTCTALIVQRCQDITLYVDEQALYDTGYDDGATYLPPFLVSSEHLEALKSWYNALPGEGKVAYNRGFFDGYSSYTRKHRVL